MRGRKYNSAVAFVALLIFMGCKATQAAPQAAAPNKAANKAAASQKPSQNGQGAQNAGDSAEADKVLYEKAMNDLKHARFDTARLSLQTLINTYPDSEYLAKSK